MVDFDILGHMIRSRFYRFIAWYSEKIDDDPISAFGDTSLSSSLCITSILFIIVTIFGGYVHLFSTMFIPYILFFLFVSVVILLGLMILQGIGYMFYKMYVNGVKPFYEEYQKLSKERRG